MGKKDLLIVSMLNDQTTDKSGPRYIRNTDSTLAFLKDSILKGLIKADRILLVDYNRDTNNLWSDENHPIAKLIIANDDWFHVDNRLYLKDIADGSDVVVNGSDLDFVFDKNTYNLSFVGLDLFGSMSNTMKRFAKDGYTVRYFADASHLYGKDVNAELKEAGVYRHFINYRKKGTK